jgi:DNA-binding IclR family transcriptional regulator
MTGPAETNGTQSVDRALRLLSLVGGSVERGLSLQEAVEASGCNKATARRLLLALVRAGLVDQDETDRRYRLGKQVYVLGTFAAPRFGLLEMAMESLIRLSRKTGDACFLSMRRHNHALCVHREEGTYPIRSHVLQKGMEHPLGVGAGSLAMLAALDDAEIDRIMAENRDAILRDYPATTLPHILAAVQETRRKGHALNPGVFYPSSWAIGVALHHPDGSLAGALSIAAIDSRMQEARQRELAELLREEALCIRNKLARLVPPAAKPGTTRRPAGATKPRKPAGRPG